MNKRNLKYAILLPMILIIGSCNLLTDDPNVLINDRINGFETTLNNGAYSDMQKHFHPDMPSFDSYADPKVLNSGLFSAANAPFEFGSPTISDRSDGNKNAVGSFSHNNTSENGTYSAIMRKDGDSWKIFDMVITIGSKDLIIRNLK